MQNLPSLRTHEVSGLTELGKMYRFKVRAYNHEGYTDSDPFLAVYLSDEPDTPTEGPLPVARLTNEQQITVTFGPQSVDKNGGSPLLSYDLQMDDGIGGDFSSLVGFEHDSLETIFTVTQAMNQRITSGAIFRFRYRVRNVNGWSLFSPITHVKAATVP